MLLKYVRFDEARLADVRVYRAETVGDIKAALTLLHDVYTTVGIIKPNEARLHVTKYNALPTTMIFVAKKGDRVVGTLSMVLDTDLGLPADSTHRAEVDSLRAQGLALAEVVGTACASEYRGSGLVLYLYRIMVHSALRANLDRVVMRAAPKGALLYEELMVCQRLGATRPDPLLNNKPFAALTLDLQTCADRAVRRFDGLVPYVKTPHYYFFGKDLPQLEVPDTFTVTTQRREAVASLLCARHDLFRSLPTNERVYYRSILPEVDFSCLLPSVPI
ncbi:hypothetical protein [Kribbella sp. NPDC023855]|uniref:N-acyl amino acid synthase FeeM domain-containing protein n=1 Tax=Kribbella sp. NPDC023855 TaxID=3154698 RepID=UPI003404131A